ncbi:MAG: hypothetical protein U0176_22080 [Bacteroidia bacterium]
MVACAAWRWVGTEVGLVVGDVLFQYLGDGCGAGVGHSHPMSSALFGDFGGFDEEVDAGAFVGGESLAQEAGPRGGVLVALLDLV